MAIMAITTNSSIKVKGVGEGRVLEEALGQLSERDKAFVQDVLNGNGWAELGMPKATFYRRLKKVEEAVRLTP